MNWIFGLACYAVVVELLVCFFKYAGEQDRKTEQTQDRPKAVKP
jgi:hypothetical protein